MAPGHNSQRRKPGRLRPIATANQKTSLHRRYRPTLNQSADHPASFAILETILPRDRSSSEPNRYLPPRHDNPGRTKKRYRSTFSENNSCRTGCVTRRPHTARTHRFGFLADPSDQTCSENRSCLQAGACGTRAVYPGRNTAATQPDLMWPLPPQVAKILGWTFPHTRRDRHAQS